MSPPQNPPPKKSKWRKWIRFLMLCLAGMIVFVVDYWAFPYGSSPLSGRFNRGENGLWLRYTWYFGEKSPEELRELPLRLKEHQIQSAWFHVRVISKSGKLNFRYPDKARQLISAIHQAAPDVRAMAWVYVGNKRGAGEVNLANRAIRLEMVAEAVWLTTVCGFDGIQWDYEICDDNDPDLVNLLRETRAALPSGKIISVATPMWLPSPLHQWGWSEEYFARVAALCDEIAVMCYDSGFLTPRSYVWITAQQVPHITQAVAKGNPRCRVFLGVPTYGKGFFSHNPHAENLRLALYGVRQGIANTQTNRTVLAGVAPFADYTTEADEWEIWRGLWLETANAEEKSK